MQVKCRTNEKDNVQPLLNIKKSNFSQCEWSAPVPSSAADKMHAVDHMDATSCIDRRLADPEYGAAELAGRGEAMSENTGLISPRALGPGLGMCNGLLRALLVHFAQLGLLQRPRRRRRGHLPSGSSLRHYQLLQTASCLRHRLPSPRQVGGLI